MKHYLKQHNSTLVKINPESRYRGNLNILTSKIRILSVQYLKHINVDIETGHMLQNPDFYALISGFPDIKTIQILKHPKIKT